MIRRTFLALLGGALAWLLGFRRPARAPIPAPPRQRPRCGIHGRPLSLEPDVPVRRDAPASSWHWVCRPDPDADEVFAGAWARLGEEERERLVKASREGGFRREGKSRDT